MSHLLIPDVDDATLERLRQRAARHGRSVETEARAILAEATPLVPAVHWEAINALREALAAGGRTFPDSVEQIREDRAR